MSTNVCRDLSNHTRMSTIQSRTLEKKAKNHATLILSPNPKSLKAFLKTFPTQMKPCKCPAKEKKMRPGKRKVKVKIAVSLLNPKISKFCFLHMPELRKLIFCIWIRRPQSVRPANGFVISFSSL